MKQYIKNGIITIMIACILVLSFLMPIQSRALENSGSSTLAPTASGSCGIGVFWEYFEDTQTLYIHGKGSISSSPWDDTIATKTKSIVVENEINQIDEGVFSKFKNVSELTVPFIGQSAQATNTQGILGYFFNREEVKIKTIHCEKITTGVAAGTGYISTVYIISSGGKTSSCYNRGSYSSSCIEAAKEMIAFVSDEAKDNFILLNEKSSNDFVNEYWSWCDTPQYNYTWQYSVYNIYGNYGIQSSRCDYPRGHYGYSLCSYYYDIPSSLKTVNITNTSRIPVAAFNNCKNIDTINIYSNISSIGDYAFQMCDAEVNYFEPSPTVNTYTNGIDTFRYSVQNGNATLLGCQTSNDAITIPDCFDQYPVTSIGYRAFAENDTIKSILLPTTVTEISDYAFYNCTSLKNITLGTNLAKIGKYAFYNTALTKITLPASLRTIDDYAFANCLALNKLVMRSGVETLGDGILYNATSLAMVTLSDTLERISDFSFYNCQSLAEINIPESVSKIGNCAFENCSALTKVSVAGNVEYIGKKAFYACNFSNFNFGNKLSYLGADSFSLTPITEVDLPNTVTQIGVQAFSDCRMLSEIYVPDSVIVGANALYNNATNLKVTIRYNTGSIPSKMFCQNKMSNVVMEEGITSIGEFAFSECPNIVAISFPQTLKNIGDYAFYKSKTPNCIMLPQKMTTIGDYAFSDASALSEIRIPDSVEKIGTKAFDDGVAAKIYYRFGVICENLFNGQLVKRIYVDNDIYRIGDGAFSNCDNLVDLSLPDTISIVGNDCFSSSSNIVLTIRTVDGEIDGNVFRGKIPGIKTIHLDNSNIGDYAFADNVGIEKVTISEASEGFTIISIGNHAFEGCVGLTDLVLPASVNSLGSHAFYGCTSLASVNIPSGITQINPYTFYNCSSLVEVTLPQTVLSIGEYAFYGCSDMTEINIPSEIKTIPNYAFYGCSSLVMVSIPNAVTNIGDYAFYGCLAMHSVSMSNQCISIGNYAFYNCKTLILTAFPDSLKSIGNYAFASCSKLTDISIGDSIEILGEGAFYNCTELCIVKLGKGITILPQQVFGGCVNLSTLYVYAPLSYIDVLTFYGAEDVTVHCGKDDYMIDFFNENDIGYIIEGSIVYQYKIIFVTDDGEVISSALYEYGETVVLPENPIKSADNTYTYIFSGWDQPIHSVNGNMTYTAVFTPIYIEYTIVFRDYNGETIDSKTYHYGDSVIAPSNPTRIADKTYTYAFSGWDSEVVKCAGDAIYTATYTPTYIEYTVVFKDYDGKVISVQTYHYGDAINVPLTPVRDADLLGAYSFKSWDSAVVDCVGDATYTAIYDITYIDYTVVFKDYDGSILSSHTYHFGDSISVPSDPIRKADNTYTYTFAGWDKPVISCAGDITYNSTYTYTYIEYTIVFKNHDGEIISIGVYHYGDAVVLPAAPTRPADNTYTYSFLDWDVNVASICDGAATYVATYTSAYIDYTIIFQDYDGKIISSDTYHYGDAITLPAVPSRAADAVGSYTFTGWDSAVVNCKGNATYTAIYDIVYTDYTVIFRNYNGDILSTGKYHYGDPITIPSAPIKPADETYNYVFAGWDKEVVRCDGNMTYTAVYDASYIDYTIVFVNDDGTELSTKTYHYGDRITVPETPTKKSDNIYNYTFKAWDREVISCAGNTIYTATYTASFIDYNVVFKNDDGTILSTKTYHFGDSVMIPETPIKAADHTYTYTFIGWDKEVVACVGDAIYIATYNSVYIDYTVLFKNEDGSVISAHVYHYGDTIKVPDNPYKAADNTYTYTFAGWDSPVIACNGDKIYTATYMPVFIEYTVVFQDYDGRIISSSKYHYGQTVTKPNTPERAADSVYSYVFGGWDKAVTNCTENTVYTATYSSIYIEYKVVFKNYDGTVLSERLYHYGETVVVPDAPLKPADQSYTYNFAGWNAEITACLGNKTYTATFSSTGIEYTIVFRDYNGNIICSNTYHFGDEVVAPNAPYRSADNTYTYTFKNWDKLITTCAGDAEYTAVYDAEYIEYNITFLDWNGSTIQVVKHHYGDVIKTITAPEREADETYTYTFLSWNKELGICTGNDEFIALYESTYISYTIVFKDYDGTMISKKEYHFGDSIAIPMSPTRTSDNTYSYTFKDWGSLSNTCNGNKEYVANYTADYIDYTIVFKDYNGEIICTKTYHYGDTIDTPSNPTKDSDTTYTYTFVGWDERVNLICSGSAVYTAIYAPTYIDYTVTFKDYDGNVLSAKTYHYGDTVAIPASPMRPNDERYLYTFIGWDKDVSACEGDVVYTATYSSESKDKGLIREKNGLSNGAIVGIAAGATVVTGTAGFCIFWFVIKKKHLSELISTLKKK